MAEPDLLIEAGFSDARLAAETQKVIQKYKQMGDAAEKAFQDASGGVADSQAVKAHMRELDKLQRAYDPIYTATQKYEAAVKRLDRALQVGAIDQSKYTAEIKRAQVELNSVGTTVQQAAQRTGIAGHQLQNVGFQVQDFAVQVAGGTDASRALAQQLPQLLSGFGALGVILGTVTAIAVPLAATLFKTGDGAKELETATSDAVRALEAYRSAVADANLSTVELAARFGDAAGSARRLLEVIALSAQTEALVKQREVLDALNDRFSDLQNRVTAYQNVLASGDKAGAMGWAEDIKEKYGLATAEAIRLSEVITQLNTATDQSQRNQLMVELVTILNDAARNGQEVNAEVAKLAGEAARAGLAVEEIGAAADAGVSSVAALANEAAALADYLRDAAGAVAGLQSAIAGLSVGNIGRSAQLAALQAGQSKVDATIAGKVAEKRAELQSAFNPDDSNITGLQRELSQYEQSLRDEARLVEEIAALEKSLDPKPGSGGGGGRKRGGGKASKPDPSIFERVERDSIAIQRQIELLGKSSEEVATARARWELLDEAKRRGIPVNETLNAQIDAQAAQVGRLTGELERAEISQQQFDDAIGGVADAMSNALIQGESLRDGLAQVFAGIASDILNSGIRNALMGQFGGGGGGILGGLFSMFGGGVRGNDALSQALRGTGAFGGFRAAGGPVDPNRAYVVGEKGPEIIVPRSAGHVIPNHKLGGGGGMTYAPVFQIGGNVTADDLAAVRREAAQGFHQMRREVPGIMANHQKRTN